MRVSTRWPAAVAGVLALVLLVGCSPGTGPDPAPAPSGTPAAEPTTLSSYGTKGVAVARSPFCDRVSPTGIEHALDDAPESHRDYGNGDRVRLPDGTRTIAHEYGCEWAGADGRVARAWVFVPPVARSRAKAWVGAATAGPCTRTGTGDFGSPSVATRCRTDQGVERSWRGLYGDAWLVCTLTGRPDEVTERLTGEWCVSVLEAARA